MFNTGGFPITKLTNQTIAYPALGAGTNRFSRTVAGIAATDVVQQFVNSSNQLPGNILVTDIRVTAANTIELTMYCNILLGAGAGSINLDFVIYKL